jgi:Flp pilus assembly protein TadD
MRLAFSLVALVGLAQAQQRPPVSRPLLSVADVVPYTPTQETPQQTDAGIRELMQRVWSVMQQGQTDEALKLVQSEVAKEPKRLDLRKLLGDTAVRAGKYDLAISTFQGILKEVDARPSAAGDLYLRIGESYRRKGDLDSAVTNFQHARELLPENVVAINLFASVLVNAGRWREAEAEYRKAIKLDPNNVIALNNFAYALAENGGDLDEALDLAQRAREVPPDPRASEAAELRLRDGLSDTLGWIYLKKNYTDQAIATFRELVQKYPEDSTYHYQLGTALAQKGETVSAIEQLKAALERNPVANEAAKIRHLLEALEKK